MGHYMPTVPCDDSVSCMAQVHPQDLAAHRQWHANMRTELKRANPLLNISLF